MTPDERVRAAAEMLMRCYCQTALSDHYLMDAEKVLEASGYPAEVVCLEGTLRLVNEEVRIEQKARMKAEAEVERLRHDLNRALDALDLFVKWHADDLSFDPYLVAALTAARAVLAAHDREAPGGRMSELRSEVLDHFRSTAGEARP